MKNMKKMANGYCDTHFFDLKPYAVDCGAKPVLLYIITN